MTNTIQFKYLKKEDRDQLPDADFGYVKGSRRLFPITDKASVMDAARLIGRAKGLTEKEREAVKDKIKKIAKKKNFPVPKSWESEAKMSKEHNNQLNLVTIFGEDLAK